MGLIFTADMHPPQLDALPARSFPAATGQVPGACYIPPIGLLLIRGDDEWQGSLRRGIPSAKNLHGILVRTGRDQNDSQGTAGWAL